MKIIRVLLSLFLLSTATTTVAATSKHISHTIDASALESVQFQLPT
jgi:hypothetical protein